MEGSENLDTEIGERIAHLVDPTLSNIPHEPSPHELAEDDNKPSVPFTSNNTPPEDTDQSSKERDEVFIEHEAILREQSEIDDVNRLEIPKGVVSRVC
jgi:hypothetical protein